MFPPSPFVMARFVPRGFPGRDDPNDALVVPVAMADDEDPRVGAETEDDEAVLSLGIVRIRDDQGGIVIEYRLGLLEAHAMLAQIGLGLPFIPLET